jgi:hypothetical protein
MAEAGRVLVAHGADRLPVVRVGRLLFAGEERLAEAAAAARAPGATGDWRSIPAPDPRCAGPAGPSGWMHGGGPVGMAVPPARPPLPPDRDRPAVPAVLPRRPRRGGAAQPVQPARHDGLLADPRGGRAAHRRRGGARARPHPPAAGAGPPVLDGLRTPRTAASPGVPSRACRWTSCATGARCPPS